MSETIDRNRRALFGTAAITLAATQLTLSGLARAGIVSAQGGALADVKPGTHTSFAAFLAPGAFPWLAETRGSAAGEAGLIIATRKPALMLRARFRL
jgi:hypothetical protein